MTQAAFTFPGQGSQHVGMGVDLARNFAAARAVFEEVDEVLGQDLSGLMREGPEDELTLTENAQPALMAVSMAVMRVLEQEHGFSLADQARYVAGHSLGEYSALAAAGSLSIADAARLLRTRGQAMQQAVPVGAGAMAALMGLDLDTVHDVARKAAESDVCQVANDNAPGQVVISGSRAAVDRAVELARERGARRSVLLPVSAPFHCELMQPAADRMAEALNEVTIKAPSVPVVVNVRARPESEPDELRQRLVEQVTGTVRWRETIEFMAGEGITRIYEIGAGKVLSGLARRISRELETKSIGTAEDIDAASKALGAQA
ncbi:ACP S-malonyltransferase [Dichotomicrobium thermohalophilum]|uniref:Malonyl CoA-acyl carrier protein transacylase n=1 Tax=Dichotomicrobium thermohalophilum TaxID=933063 RepID=A0A397Q9J8_9HYPH|nr:ACP S-malonyltransferase [Dichotomicrobium thermohalophilum]RIA56475.1 [acyl-carrier-protein] S-malonyltransferase [Dichotomicrobium thermohalophilum]